MFSRLAKANQIRLYIPYVVEREFVTFLEQVQRKRIEKAINALTAASNYALIGPRTANLATSLDAIRSSIDQIVSERGAAFVDWLNQNEARRMGLTLDQTVKAMEAYFAGLPPLKQPKSRKDIPDSFIFQSVLELHADHPSDFGTVVEDGPLRTALCDAGIECWSSLREFLTSSKGQSLVAEEFITTNKRVACEHVRSITRSKSSEIAVLLEENLLSMAGSIIYGDSLPGENGEIYFTSIDVPFEVEVDSIEYLGEFIFIADLTARVELMYEFVVSNFDAIDLEDSDYGLSRLNKHYQLAETSDIFRFSASLQIRFPGRKQQRDNTNELIASLTNPQLDVYDLRDIQIVREDLDT